MKKLLTKADLTKIAKQYQLDKAEQQELAEFAAELNREQREGVDTTCSQTHFVLFSSLPASLRGEWWKAQAAAATAVLLYLAKRIQDGKKAENMVGSEVYSLEKTSSQLAALLGETAHNIKWFFIGLWSDARFSKCLHTAHACGLDTLEIL